MKFLALLVLFLIAQSTFAGTEDIYQFKWLDPDKKVFVLQEKTYENRHKIYFDIGYGTSSFSDFQDTSVLRADVGWYFAEEWGIELFYNSYDNQNNESYKAVQRQIGVIPFIIKVDSALGGVLVYSPFYGKLNTYNLIYYLDWNFGLGAATLDTQDNYASFVAETADTYVDKKRSAFIAKTQVRFFISKHFHINLDYAAFFVRAPEPGTGGNEKYIRYGDFYASLGFSF
jgi:outer membrane beta-barrel protein